VEPSSGSGGRALYKHVLLVFLSLFPFGASTVVALGTWVVFDDLLPVVRLTVAVILWIVAFAGTTRAFWKAVELITPW